MRLTLPLRLVSEANARGHWAVRAKRVKRQRTAVGLVLNTQPRPTLPCVVTVTRIAPRALDGHDNLQASCKATIDAIAQWLGVDDRDPRVTWRYGQRRGKAKEYGVEIEAVAVTVCRECF